MNLKDYETEINVKDIILVILRKIWVIILVSSILGTAFFVYKIEKRGKTSDILDVYTKLNFSETDYKYQRRVQNIDKAREYVDMIEILNSQIDHQRQYITDSIYMQIDAENTYQSFAQISFTIPSNTPGIDTTLYTAYEREIRAGNYLNGYADELSVRTDYIKELIHITSSLDNSSIIDADENVDQVFSIYISVIGTNGSFCDDIMNLIISEVESLHTDFNKSITIHSMSVIGIQQVVKIDTSLRDGQNSQIAKIDSLQKQIATYYDALDKLAKELGLSSKDVFFEYFITHSEDAPDVIPSEVSERKVSRSSVVKSGIKFGVVGFVFGIIIVAAIVIVRYIFGRKIITQAQFFSKYVFLNNIGVMKPKYKRSKYSRFIDFLSGDDTKLADENANKIISNNYFNLTRNFENVLITGVGDKDLMNSCIVDLGLRGDFKPDMFNNPDIIKSISDYDGVVLIEQRKSSSYKKITEEIKLITNSGTELVGAIIL